MAWHARLVTGAAAVAAALAFLALAPDAAADSVFVANATLPQPRSSTSAAWDGDAIWVFGGIVYQGPDDVILRYDPGTDTLELMDEHLPWAVSGAPAVWDPRVTETCPRGCAYLFGGNDPRDDILRYDPTSGTVTVMTAKLPEKATAAAAVFDGTHAYILGGCVPQGSFCQGLATIVRYDPLQDAVVTMDATLPSGRWGAGAVWDPRDRPEGGCPGGCAYLLGGSDGYSLAEIVRFSPAQDDATLLTASLPDRRAHVSAFWDGERAYVFGGFDNLSGSKTAVIARFDPVAEVAVAMDATLPKARYGTSAAWGGDGRGFVFGGTYCCWDVSEDEIVAYDTRTPRAPLAVQASAGPGVGEITLHWQAPSEPGASPVEAYRIYGGNASNDLRLLAEVGVVDTFKEAGLPNGFTRHYRVSAVNGHGEGAQSVGASARTFRPPDPPQGLMAAPGPGITSLSLAWKPPLDDGGTPLVAYRLYRDGGLIAELGPDAATHEDQPTFADLGAAALPDAVRTHRYRVSGVNIAGEGEPSLEACASANPVLLSPTSPLEAMCDPPPGWRRASLQVRLTPTRLAEGGVAGTWEFLPPEAPPPPAVLDPSVSVELAFQYDPSQRVCLDPLPCLVPAPDDPAWVASRGANAAAGVVVQVEDRDGQVLAQRAFTVPYAGQALGALSEP